MTWPSDDLCILVSFSWVQAYSWIMWIIKFDWFDLDLDPITLVFKLDLDIVEMYTCTKSDAPTFNIKKVIAWTDTQADNLNWNYYLSAYADGNKNLWHPIFFKFTTLAVILVNFSLGSTMSSWCKKAALTWWVESMKTWGQSVGLEPNL